MPVVTPETHPAAADTAGLSIIICTYNRYGLLQRNLAAIVDLGYPQKYEVIIVDNSTDETARRSFEREFLPTYPGVRSIFSSPPGLSRARNLGLEAATHEIVAYLDDDACPLAGWAEAMLGAFTNPVIAYVGGRIELQWETRRPAWLPAGHDAYYTETDYGDESRPLQAPEYAAGANIAFRKTLALRAGGFATALGRIGTGLLSNEELRLCRALRQNGHTGWYEAKAVVRHFIPEERISRNWLLRRVAWQGLSDCLDDGAANYESAIAACRDAEDPRIRDAIDLLTTYPENARQMRERCTLARALGDILFRPLPEPPFPEPELPAALSQILDCPEVLLVDFTSHEFLCTLYSGPRAAKYCINDHKNFNPWSDPDRLVRETEAVLSFCRLRGIRNVFFITISPYFFLNRQQLRVFEGSGPRLFGIFHRDIPATPQQVEAASYMAGRFTRFFVFHEECLTLFDHMDFKDKIGVIANPPALLSSLLRHPLRRRAFAPEKPVTLGFLGTIYEGKGTKACAGMLCRLPAAMRAKLRCVFAGGAKIPDEVEAIRSRLEDAGIEGVFMTQDFEDNYRVLSDAEFAEAVLMTDIVMLPYHGVGANAFSGAFLDGLMAGSTFVATDNSVMGRVLKREGLGHTFTLDLQDCTPEHVLSLEVALTEAMNFVQSPRYAEARENFLHSYYQFRTLEAIVLNAVRE